MRTSRFLAPAVLILASACLNDRPVAPRDSGALALKVALPAQSGKQTVELLVYYYPYSDRRIGALGQYDVFDQTYHTQSGYTRIAANFPLADCLQYFVPDALGPYCDVNVAATLRIDSVFVDQQTIYGLRVRPGVTTQADSLFLGYQGGSATAPDRRRP
jgi:hypothetical protein